VEAEGKVAWTMMAMPYWHQAFWRKIAALRQMEYQPSLGGTTSGKGRETGADRYLKWLQLGRSAAYLFARRRS